MSGVAPSRGDTAVTATIAASGTKSDAIDLRGSSAAGYILPATFTGTGMTFEVSVDGANFTPHSTASVTVAQGKAYDVPAGVAVFPWIKLVSGSTESSARSILVARLR